MNVVFAWLENLSRRIFHKRSIIIISSHKTNHISISGPLQLAIVLTLIASVSLASYSTGSYMAARSIMHKQELELKSVANARIQTNFDYTIAKLDPQNLGPVSSAIALPLQDQAYALPTLGHEKLFARIAILEDKVHALRTTNAEILHEVQERTHTQLANLESIIRKTGLNPDTLKKEAAKLQDNDDDMDLPNSQAAYAADNQDGQGGPFIADETPNSLLSPDLAYRLDQVALLRNIVNTLPLGNPLKVSNFHSNYGRRIDPFTGRLAFHPGIDISGAIGSRVMATGDGQVIFAGWRGAYGNCVEIAHGFGVTTRYGHLKAIKVSVGTKIKEGQVIGIQGSTGRSTGDHVHYEVRYNNKPLNPTNFVNAGYHVSKIDAQAN